MLRFTGTQREGGIASLQRMEITTFEARFTRKQKQVLEA